MALPPRGPKPGRRRQREESHERPMAHRNLANRPPPIAAHVARDGVEIAEAWDDVVVGRPCPVTRCSAAFSIAVINGLVKVELSEASQQRKRGSLRRRG